MLKCSPNSSKADAKGKGIISALCPYSGKVDFSQYMRDAANRIIIIINNNLIIIKMEHLM